MEGNKQNEAFDIKQFAKEERAKYLKLIDIAYRDELKRFNVRLRQTRSKVNVGELNKKEVFAFRNINGFFQKVGNYYINRDVRGVFKIVEENQIVDGEVRGAAKVQIKDDGTRKLFGKDYTRGDISVIEYGVLKGGLFCMDGIPASMVYKNGKLDDYTSIIYDKDVLTVDEGAKEIEQEINYVQGKINALNNQIKELLLQQIKVQNMRIHRNTENIACLGGSRELILLTGELARRYAGINKKTR